MRVALNIEGSLENHPQNDINKVKSFKVKT